MDDPIAEVGGVSDIYGHTAEAVRPSSSRAPCIWSLFLILDARVIDAEVRTNTAHYLRPDDS